MQTEEIGTRELELGDYIAMLRRHWVLIAVLALIGPPLGYAAAKVVPPKYVSQTLVMVQRPNVKVESPIDNTGMSAMLASLKGRILSRSYLEQIIHKDNLYASQINTKPMDMLVAQLQSVIDVSPVAPLTDNASRDNLPGFSVTVTMDNASNAQSVCAQVTSMFIEQSRIEANAVGVNVNEFYANELATDKTSLDEQDKALAQFTAAHLGEMPGDGPGNLAMLANLNNQLESSTQALTRAQQDKTYAENMLQQQLSAAHATATGQSPDALLTQLTTLKTQLASLQSMYKDDYPDVVKAKADIAALEKQIAISNSTNPSPDGSKTNVEPASVTQLRAQIHGYDLEIAEKTKEQDQLKQQIEVYQARVQAAPAVEQQFTELSRGYKTAQDAYNDLLTQQHNAAMATDLTQQQQGIAFQILDPANLPSEPIFPNKRMFTAAGFGGGLGLGVVLALFLGFKDTSLKNERDVEQSLRLPVLAMIPAMEPTVSKKQRTGAMLQPGTADAGLGLRA
jgi:succinoglycan biosynthesis transport protein ExoP